MTDGAEVRAARRAARTEPVRVSLGSEEFTFEPELPLDIVLAYDTLGVQSRGELEVWTVAHLLLDCVCDTSCADASVPYAERNCPAERDMRQRLRKVRVDGRRLTQDDLTEFHKAVLDNYAVTEGESPSSADLPAPAGEPSSGTPSDSDSTSTDSGEAGTAAPAA